VIVKEYGVATVSRIDKIIVLFCKILSLLKVCFAKETYNLIDPTNQSHPITSPRGARHNGSERDAETPGRGVVSGCGLATIVGSLKL